MIFVDASALTAIMLEEPEAGDLSVRLAQASDPLTSGISAWECCRAVSRAVGFEIAQSMDELTLLLQAASVRMVPVGEAETRAALDAHARFGKGRHPAKLNMGDCFSYACARVLGAPLLYKGDDFALTDIERA